MAGGHLGLAPRAAALSGSSRALPGSALTACFTFILKLRNICSKNKKAQIQQETSCDRDRSFLGGAPFLSLWESQPCWAEPTGTMVSARGARRTHVSHGLCPWSLTSAGAVCTEVPAVRSSSSHTLWSGAWCSLGRVWGGFSEPA